MIDKVVHAIANLEQYMQPLLGGDGHEKAVGAKSWNRKSMQIQPTVKRAK